MKKNTETLDIFQLFPTKNWNEEQKIEIFLQFMDVFILFVFSDLSKKISSTAESELQSLLDAKAPASQVIAFYKTLLPDMDEMMYQKALEFKKIFLIKLYEDSLKRVQDAKSTQEIEFWQTILQHAYRDEWNEIQVLLTVFQSTSSLTALTEG